MTDVSPFRCCLSGIASLLGGSDALEPLELRYAQAVRDQKLPRR